MNDLKVGIFSWNIGDIGDNSKIDNLLSSALNTYTDGYPDIFVFGFQEYHILPFKLNINDKTIFDNILGSINSKDKGKYKILDSSSACSQLSSFETMLLILIKTEYTSDKNTIIKKSECLSSTGSQTLLIGTKGYELIKFTLKGNELIFVNAHFPFQNEDTLNKFYNSLQQFIKNVKPDNSLIFIFGDMNSRCLLTNEYKKDVFNCENNDSKFENWCSIKKELESKDFNVTYYFHDYKNQITDSDLINKLKSTDLYIKAKESLFFKDGFQEGEINFLPTYKRDSVSGKFKLSKDKAGRLPGYADRIFFKTPDNKSIQCLKYGSLGVEGNDHLPIGGHYLITNKTTGGRTRTRQKSRTRSKSKKSRSKGKK